MFFDEEFDSIFENVKKDGKSYGPFYYGYTMTVGPDGKPQIREYGNVQHGLAQEADTREPLIDTIIDEKENVLKLVAEIPGVEKSDIKVVVEGNVVNVDAEHGDKKYHGKVPIKRKVDPDSVKASYTNGILEVQFKLKGEDKPKGKTVEVN